MKDKKYLNHLKAPAVAPLGSFFCPEPQLDYGLVTAYLARLSAP